MNPAAEILHSIIQPGETIVMAGRRGHGKTATAVSLCEHAMRGDYGHEDVQIITNVVFGRRTSDGQPVEAYPPGVYHEDTLAGTMRRIGQILEVHGRRGATIIWLLDEAQNFMLADQNGSRENMALTKYLGNARKFGVCNFFLTPTINNLAPRVRCFPQGEAKSGFCSCQMVKDKAEASRLVGQRADPRSLTFMRTDPDASWTPIFIQPTPWIRDVYSPEVAVGAYGYDTISTATFAVGENAQGVPFSFERFIRATSGGLSHELPGKIAAHFAEWDMEGLPAEDDEKAQTSRTSQAPQVVGYTKEDLEFIQVRAIHNRRMMGDTWTSISAEWGEPKTSLEYRYRKYYPSSAAASSQTGNGPCGAGDSTRVRGYIQPYKEGLGGGVGGVSVPSGGST